MKHLTKVVSCSFLTFALTLVARGDVDREKTAGEEKARPELETGPRPGQSHEEYHRHLIEEGESNLKQIQKLLDEIQGDLSQQQTGSKTQQKQKQVMERLTRLIEEMAKGCKACQSGQGGGGKPTSTSGKKPQSQERSEEKKQGGEQRENQKDLAGKKKQEDAKKEQNDEPLPNNQVAEGENPQNEDPNLDDSQRNRRAWGFLPPKVRDEMLSASGKEAPLEYREIIERYYKRISDFYEKMNRPSARESRSGR